MKTLITILSLLITTNAFCLSKGTPLDRKSCKSFHLTSDSTPENKAFIVLECPNQTHYFLQGFGFAGMYSDGSWATITNYLQTAMYADDHHLIVVGVGLEFKNLDVPSKPFTLITDYFCCKG